MSLVGTRVGHILILERLGRGGMGEVYVGLDETLQRKVALKAIRGEHRLRPAARARFLREARILSQLEHPNICRIYDYVGHGSTELLVLELIDGENLAQAIDRGLEPARKMEIALEIAGVLAVAHAAGIVHRDLKPDNVMISSGGAVKVLDFGLARAGAEEPAGENDSWASAGFLGDPAAAETVQSAPGPQDAQEFRTAVGSIMGTPLYMSPEQARGEPVTTASDMYSFGLLLQTLFTGLPPYERGLDSPTLIRKVGAGETLPLVGVPADLAALVSRLKALAPAARVTAVETVRQLEWIRDKPKRRLRRLALAAALAVAVLAALKYTLDLRRERAIALQARGVAEQRREQAEELISFMLGDVREKLEPLGKLEILDDVGDKALLYFASVPENELSDAELARRATALYQIGDVRIKQGDLLAAMEAFRESVTLSEGLVERHPDDAQWLQTLGTSHFWVGNAYWAQRALDPALAEFEAYRAISKRLVEKDPANPDWKMELAYGDCNVAGVLEFRGELASARPHVESCVEIVEGLVAAAPDRDDWRFELATNHLQAGRVEEALGEIDDALGHYRADLGIAVELVAKDPQNAGWLEHLAVSHNYVGTALERRGEQREAREHYISYVRIMEDLVARDESNLWWQGILAIGQRNLGWLRHLEGDSAGGLALLRSASHTLDRLATQDTTRRQWQSEHGFTRVRVGQVLRAAGDPARALAEADAARGILERLAAEAPNDAQPQRFLSECELLRGEVLASQGEADAARQAWERARDVIEPFARDSRDATLLAPLAGALLLLERTEEARPFLARLDAQGFREPRISGERD